jgi:hypothetical protein
LPTNSEQFTSRDPQSYELVKDYGQIHQTPVNFATVCPKDVYLFTGDDVGLCQWDIVGQCLFRDYGKVHLYDILSMRITLEGRLVFLGID